MDVVYIADECYPYIAVWVCQKCGNTFPVEYTDKGIRYVGDSVCKDHSNFIPFKGYPTYIEWKKTRDIELSTIKAVCSKPLDRNTLQDI